MAQDQVKISLGVEFSDALSKLEEFSKKIDDIVSKDQSLKLAVQYNIVSDKKNTLAKDAKEISSAFDTAAKKSSGTVKPLIDAADALRKQKATLLEQNRALAIAYTAAQRLGKNVDKISKAYKLNAKAIEEINKLLPKTNKLISNAQVEAFKLSKAFKKLPSSGIDKIGASFTGLIAKLTAGGILVEAFKQTVGGIGDLVQQGAAFQQLTIGLEAFAGSTQNAQFLYEEFRNIALKSPFGLPQVAQAGKTLLAFGLTSTEAASQLKLLARGAGATGSDLNNLARNLGQINAQGRAFKRDLDQFNTAGIGITKGLAVVLDKTVEQIQELSSEGKIGFGEVSAALEFLAGSSSAFADIANQQLNTVQGQFGNLQTSVFELSGALLDEFGPALVGVIKTLTGVVDTLKNSLSGLGQVIASLALAGLSAGVFNLVKAFTQLGKSILAAKLAANAGSLVNLFGFLGGSAGKLSVYLKQLAQKATEVGGSLKLSGYQVAKLGKLFSGFGAQLVKLVPQIAAVAGGIYLAIEAFNAFRPAQEFQDAPKDIENLTDAVKAFETAALQSGNAIETQKGSLLSAYEIWQRQKTAIEAASPALRTFGQNVRDFVTGLTPVRAFGNVFADIGNNIKFDANFKKADEALKELVASTVEGTTKLQALVDLFTEEGIDITPLLAGLKQAETSLGVQVKIEEKMLEKARQRKAELEVLRRQNGGLTTQQQQQLVNLTRIVNQYEGALGPLREQLDILKEINNTAQETAKQQNPQQAQERSLKEEKELLNIRKEAAKVQLDAQNQISEAKERANNKEIKDLEEAKRLSKEGTDKTLKAIDGEKRAVKDRYDKEKAAIRELGPAQQALADYEEKILKARANSSKLSKKARLEAAAELEKRQKAREEAALDLRYKKESARLDSAARSVKSSGEAAEKELDSRIRLLKEENRQLKEIQGNRKRAFDTEFGGAEQQLRQKENLRKIEDRITAAKKSGTQAEVDQLQRIKTQVQEAQRLATQQSNEFNTSNLRTANRDYANFAGTVEAAGKKVELFYENGKLVNTLRTSDLGDSYAEASDSINASLTSQGIFITSQNQATQGAQELSSTYQDVAKNIQAAVVAAGQLEGGGRFTGGLIRPDIPYTANELGQEAFLSDSGFLNYIKTDKFGKWASKEYGTVIPAHLTKSLNIPDGGMNVAPADRVGVIGNVHKDQDSAVSAAMDRIMGDRTQQEAQLGKLTQSINNMANKEWAVNVKIDNQSSASLINKAKRGY